MNAPLVAPLLGIFLAAPGSGGSSPLGPGAWSPVALTNGDAGAITLGQIVYLSANDTARKAFSNGTEAQATAVAMCIDATIAPAASGRFVFGGVVLLAGAGKTYATLGYLGTTPGVLAAAPDLTAGHYLGISGFWMNATDFSFASSIPVLN